MIFLIVFAYENSKKKVQLKILPSLGPLEEKAFLIPLRFAGVHVFYRIINAIVVPNIFS